MKTPLLILLFILRGGQYHFLHVRDGCLVEIHQDDIIVHAPYEATYDARLLKLFQRSHDKNVTINPKKCFFVINFECLGYLVNSNGFKPDFRRFLL